MQEYKHSSDEKQFLGDKAKRYATIYNVCSNFLNAFF